MARGLLFYSGERNMLSVYPNIVIGKVLFVYILYSNSIN